MIASKVFDKITEKVNLNRMSSLGKFRDLSLDTFPAYSGKNNNIDGYPAIPKDFSNLKNLIPESDWWWIPSGTDTHNKQGKTTEAGSFEFRFTCESFFFFRCKYDPFLGFTKIEISYDELDAKINNPSRITIENMENIVRYDYKEMLRFLLINCNFTEKEQNSINCALED